MDRPWVTYNGDILVLDEAPTELLVQLLHAYKTPHVEKRAISHELRTRPDAKLSANTLKIMESHEPPPCACGGPGLYRVGKQTFCDAAGCKRVAFTVAHLLPLRSFQKN